MPEDTLTIPQVAKRLGVPVSRVRSWIFTRVLPATYDYKGFWRITEDDLDAFLRDYGDAVIQAKLYPRQRANFPKRQ